jgi:hypothetical protein
MKLFLRSVIVPAIYLAAVIWMMRPARPTPRYVSDAKTVVEVTDKQ